MDATDTDGLGLGSSAGRGLVTRNEWGFKSIDATNWDGWVERYAGDGEIFVPFLSVTDSDLAEAARFAVQLYGRDNVLLGDTFDTTKGVPVASSARVGIYVLPGGLVHAAKRWMTH